MYTHVRVYRDTYTYIVLHTYTHVRHIGRHTLSADTVLRSATAVAQ